MEKARFHLGADRYITLVTVTNEPLGDPVDILHIRIYDNNRLATKKGVVLNASRWGILKHQMGFISGIFNAVDKQAIVPLKEHLGGRIFATMDGVFPILHLRKYFKPNMESGNNDSPIPTRLGVTLRQSEYQKLVELIPSIEKLSNELKKGAACYESNSHANQMGYFGCDECSPFYTGEIF